MGEGFESHGPRGGVGSTPTGATERNNTGIRQNGDEDSAEADPISDPIPADDRSGLVARLASELSTATVRGDLAAARVLNDALARLLEEPRGGVVVDLRAARDGRGR
jgi:hypothetical protein